MNCQQQFSTSPSLHNFQFEGDKNSIRLANMCTNQLISRSFFFCQSFLWQKLTTMLTQSLFASTFWIITRISTKSQGVHEQTVLYKIIVHTLRIFGMYFLNEILLMKGKLKLFFYKRDLTC